MWESGKLDSFILLGLCILLNTNWQWWVVKKTTKPKKQKNNTQTTTTTTKTNQKTLAASLKRKLLTTAWGGIWKDFFFLSGLGKALGEFQARSLIF